MCFKRSVSFHRNFNNDLVENILVWPRWKTESVPATSGDHASAGGMPVYADLATIYAQTIGPSNPREHYNVPTKQPPPLPPPRKIDEISNGYVPMKPITVHSEAPQTSDEEANAEGVYM